MAKKTRKLNGFFKMADFLLDLQYGSKRLFCASGHDPYTLRISFFYVILEGGASILKYSRGRCWAILPRPCKWPVYDFNWCHYGHVCQVSWLYNHPLPLKNSIVFHGEECVAMATAFDYGLWAAGCSITKVLHLSWVNFRCIGQIY